MPSAPSNLRRCAEIFSIVDTNLLLYRCSLCQDWFGEHEDCTNHVKTSCMQIISISKCAEDTKSEGQPPSLLDTHTDVYPDEDQQDFEDDVCNETYLDYDELESKSNTDIREADYWCTEGSLLTEELPSADLKVSQRPDTPETIVDIKASLDSGCSSDRITPPTDTTEPFYVPNEIPQPRENRKFKTQCNPQPKRPRPAADPPSEFTQLILAALRTPANPHLTCDICNHNFISRSRLFTHMSSHHGPHLQCKRCPAKFTSYKQIRAHAKTHARRVYCCEYCGAQQTDRRNHETHVRTHTGEKPYKCEVCPRAFNDTYKLKMHQRRHNNDFPFKCELCPKRFVAAGLAANHQKSHEGLKPFQCEQCDKWFVSNQGLTMHMKIHSGERPLACGVCDKRFLWAHSLRKHMNMHEGKSLAFSQCGVPAISLEAGAPDG